MKRFFYLSAFLFLFTGCVPLAPFLGSSNRTENNTQVSPASSSGSEPTVKAEPKKSKVDQTVLRVTADQLNRTAPKQIDEETTLTRVDVQEDGLLYNFQLVTKTSADINADAKEIIRNVVKERVCSDPSTKANLKDGYSFYYSYVGKDKLPITKFTVAPKDCGFN
jgi:ABC-type oligopeptide transport system substrate-binding subunit